MFYTTTSLLEGYTISQYCGLVTGTAVLGVDALKDMAAGVRDIVGGRSGSYENQLGKAKEIAMKEMSEEAQKLGADAVYWHRFRLPGDQRCDV